MIAHDIRSTLVIMTISFPIVIVVDLFESFL